MNYRHRCARRKELTQRRLARRRFLVAEILMRHYSQPGYYALVYSENPYVELFAGDV